MFRPSLRYFGYFILLLLVALGAIYENEVSLATTWQKYAHYPSARIPVAGIMTHIREEGPAEKPLVVLIHGTSSALFAWDGWAKELKDSFRVIRMDLPGFGLSDVNPAKDYSVDFYLSFLESFMDARQIDSCILAGQGIGGLLAWNYAVRHPRQVQKLCLIDPLGYPDDQDNHIPLAYRLATIPLVRSIVKRCTPEILFRYTLRDMYFDDSLATDTAIKLYQDMILKEGNREAFIKRRQTDMRGDYQKISSINAPVLLLWGQQDNWSPVDKASLYQRDLLHDTLIVYPHIGHVPMEEDPHTTVRDFMHFMHPAK